MVSKTRYWLPVFFLILAYLIDHEIFVPRSGKFPEDSANILYVMSILILIYNILEDIYYFYKGIKQEDKSLSKEKKICTVLSTFFGIYLVFLALGVFHNFLFTFIALIFVIFCEKITSYCGRFSRYITTKK